jgi:hypothetical protein
VLSRCGKGGVAVRVEAVGDATFSDAGVGAVLAGHVRASGGSGDDFARITQPAECTGVGEADGLLRGVEDGGVQGGWCRQAGW